MSFDATNSIQLSIIFLAFKFFLTFYFLVYFIQGLSANLRWYYLLFLDIRYFLIFTVSDSVCTDSDAAWAFHWRSAYAAHTMPFFFVDFLVVRR